MHGESGSLATSPTPVVAGLATRTAARERLIWLDALKGIGIIAVVAGHIWTRGAFRDAVYTFHMPLFFIASGAVARVMPMRVLALRLLMMLGLPALSFALLFLALDFGIEGWKGGRPIFPDVASGLSAIFLSTQTLRGPFAILWFAPCLVMARLAWNGLASRVDPAGRGMAAVMAVVLAVALLFDAYGSASPLGILPVPAALLFIWIGANWMRWRPGATAGFALFAVAAAALAWMPPLNMRAGDLGWPVAGLMGAAVIVDRLAWLVRHLPDRLTHGLAWFGRNSLIIMFLHLCFSHYLWLHLPKYALFGVALAGSLLAGALLRRNKMTRLWFLGER